ncbi:tauropine dehydrogenase [Nematostella vectensis]|uniref:tauropine dehydrogenase n=1 Tax=Nematostella vectensis TaxID=45351 RepID=UPI0013901BBD|nr:tauropine dehydrogenase [Nematostella vectensis]
MSETLRLVVCGGGNGSQALSGLAASRPNTHVTLFTLFQDEAARLKAAMGEEGIKVIQHRAHKEPEVFQGKPHVVTKNAAEAIPGCDMIVFVLPAFAFSEYLHAMKEHLQPGMSLVAAPGQAGFEFEARSILGDKYKDCTVASFESLPWACRASEFGRQVDLLGEKETIIGAVEEGLVPAKKKPIESLQYCIGPKPKLIIGSNSLVAISLMSVNAYIHPPIFYGSWKNWDQKPLKEKPLFYHGLSEESAKIMDKVSDEVVEIGKAIQRQCPNANMASVKTLYDYYMRVWSAEIEDPTNIYTVMKTMIPYKTLYHPMKEVEGGFVPDFSNRYVTEDIPFGLVVLRGIGEVAGVKTPMMDECLAWFEKETGKKYIVDGKCEGKDISSTRAPQRYGFKTIDDMLGF